MRREELRPKIIRILNRNQPCTLKELNENIPRAKKSEIYKILKQWEKKGVVEKDLNEDGDKAYIGVSSEIEDWIEENEHSVKWERGLERLKDGLERYGFFDELKGMNEEDILKFLDEFSDHPALKDAGVKESRIETAVKEETLYADLYRAFNILIISLFEGYTEKEIHVDRVWTESEPDDLAYLITLDQLDF